MFGSLVCHRNREPLSQKTADYKTGLAEGAN